MTPFLCALLGSVITIVLLVAVVRRGVRQISMTSAYREVSRQLGLSTNTRGTSIHGHLGDRRIWLGQVMVGQGTERREVHWGVLDLERPLGFEFLFKRRGMSERMFRRSRQPTLPIGEASLDRNYELHAAFPDAAQRLFSEDVVRHLKLLSERWPSIVINDNAVQVHISSPPAKTQTVMALVNMMVELAHAIDHQRASLPAPEPLAAWVAPWKTVAEARNIDLEENIPAISGSIASRRVLVIPRTGSDGDLHSEVQMFFRPHRRTGLRIEPQGGEHIVGQDIVVGNQQFDSTFVVKGYDPTSIQERLTTTVQSLILTLHQHGTVEMDDRRILLREQGMDSDALLYAIQQAEAIADAMRW